MTISVILIGLSLSLLSIVFTLAEENRKWQNLFEPIFAYGDIDAHFVSATPYREQPIEVRFHQTRAIGSNDDRHSFNDRPERTREDEPRPYKELNMDTEQGVDQAIIARIVPNLTESKPIERPKVKAKEPEQHWAALDNYYKNLRQSLSLGSGILLESGNQQGGFQFQQPSIYQILQREADEPHSFGVSNKNEQASDFPPFLLAGAITETHQHQQQQQAFSPPILNKASNSSLRLEQDFGFSVNRHSEPGISLSQGIGRESILLNRDRYANEKSKPFGQGQQAASSSLSSLINDDGDIKYLEQNKLNELLLIGQQQRRVEHQQETFNSWYDRQRSREILQEEAFCGPRNYLNSHLVPASLRQKDKLQQKHSMSPNKFENNPSNLNGQQEHTKIGLSAGEYPSHLGVYTTPQIRDDHFLCSATLIHESFALTLASCVKSSRPSELNVRAGEWNYNKNMTNPNEKPMIIRRVEQVYLFPKYNNHDSVEHDLALLRFSQPIEYLRVPYISPACQMQSRTSIKTSSCWSPVRSTTEEEYFDADGEGETKEKKVVSLIESAVKLIANDDAECYRQTKIEFFNFQYPNYICSADLRLSNWRLVLNNTDYFGSGIYCNEAGSLTLVSILHPIYPNSLSAFGYLDLSYYKPWMRNVISGRNF